MDDGGPISGIVLILLLTLVNAIVIMMKTAYENINENSVKKKCDTGDKRAFALLKVMGKSDRFFIVLELLLCFTGILIGIIFVTQILPGIENDILSNNSILDMRILKPGYHILLTVILVLIVTLFGIVLPKKIVAKHAEKVAYYTLGLIKPLDFIFRPFAYLLNKGMCLVLRIFRVKINELEDNVTEDEIISMVNEGHEQGVFDAGEAEMISNIIELDEKEAQDIMTHKKRIVAVNAEMTIEEALHFMYSENYSRYPLYEDNRDNIIGILHLKDVIGAYISDDLKDKPLKEIAREAYYVPDTQNINILFHEMQLKNIHTAIVIDEYGQTAGLVAMEDFLEEIVGNIQDEYDEDEKMVISMEEDSCVVNGSISLEELEDDLDIHLEHDDFDTLNGLLISILDRIPTDGEKATLEYAGYLFDILETKNKMIEQVRITKPSQIIEEEE
ncbi:MAG TPA: hemolysin family protein [Mobilitalea sp.]|nr:hemolysin family protein [Mobilitalea sp.]